MLYYGRDWPPPQGFDYFRTRCRSAFRRNAEEKDEQKIIECIKRGEFVVKELEALYKLKKYRAMKNRYYDEDLNQK
jgi:hypothetical protein